MSQPFSASASTTNMARPSPTPSPRVPKTGQLVDTRQSCFNAATTQVIRVPSRAVND